MNTVLEDKIDRSAEALRWWKLLRLMTERRSPDEINQDLAKAVIRKLKECAE